MRNLFKEKWQRLEAQSVGPSRARKVITLDYRDFKERVYSGREVDAIELTESLYAGDSYVLKGAFSESTMIELREKTYNYGKQNAPSFNKMLDGCPDFNSIIDAESTKKYSYNAIRRSYFFFPWNNDPLGLKETVYPVWEVYKYLGGYARDEYCRNIPSTGTVDRFQIAHYPAGGGGLEPHVDAFVNQKMIIGAMGSKRGRDYEQGGFYCIGKDNVKIDLEPFLDIGDMVCCYPTVVHGVAAVDPHLPLNWESSAGRWFLGLYSNDSDAVKERRTTSRVEIELKS